MPTDSKHLETCSESIEMFTPAASRMSALPLTPVDVLLPCFAIFTPPAAATKAEQVEMFIIFFPKPPVPQQSTKSLRLVLTFIECLRILLTAPTISSTDSPFSDNA